VAEQEDSRWRPSRRQLLWAGGIAALAFLIVVICSYVFGWKWTGFPKQTLWDWLGLLIVPAVLAVGGYLLTERQRAVDREISTQQTKTDQELADERRQDDTLQAYLDGMSHLLTDKDLHSAPPGDSLRTVARARTLTVLSRLGRGRKRSVLEFLYESGLIAQEQALLDGIVSLQKADLIKASLSEVDLEGANLKGANMREVNLYHANLRGADLSGAIMHETYLEDADLQDAILRKANLMDAKSDTANLERANLRDANLSGAHLSAAHLSGADLRGAILSGAHLSHADLSNADLSDAFLGVADLSDAFLSGAKGVTNKQLSAGATLEGAQMPDGQVLKSKYNPDGPTLEEWLKSRGEENSGP
jgi:uncharacterized protein YjbI with pentapeptide repeats